MLAQGRSRGQEAIFPIVDSIEWIFKGKKTGFVGNVGPALFS